MNNSKYTDILIRSSEVVFYDSEFGKIIHKELFKFNDEVYLDLIKIEGNANRYAFNDAIKLIINILNYSDYIHLSKFKIHFILEWKHMVRLASWCFDSKSHEKIFVFLSNSVLNNINSTNYTDIQGIFRYLLQNSRFDIFRYICHLARRNISNLLKSESIQIICHLVSPETKTIVASSL